MTTTLCKEFFFSLTYLAPPPAPTHLHTLTEDWDTKWKVPYNIGRATALLQPPGWQASMLGSLAEACLLASSHPDHNGGLLEPLHALHSARLALLLQAEADAGAAASAGDDGSGEDVREVTLLLVSR